MSLPKARDNPTEGIDITNLRTFDLKTQPPTVDYVVEMSFIGKKKKKPHKILELCIAASGIKLSGNCLTI